MPIFYREIAILNDIENDIQKSMKMPIIYRDIAILNDIMNANANGIMKWHLEIAKMQI